MEEKSLNLLSIGEASEYLGISIDTLRRWEKKGKIASYRSPGGHRYFKKDELDNMFGKKYERAPETKPRKEYETNPVEVETVEESHVEIITEIPEDNAQEVVDAIVSETQAVKSEIESFFERQPKNIEIPRIEPIRVKQNSPLPQETINLPLPPSGQKLFTSFSQIADQSSPSAKQPLKINAQYFLIIIASVVIIVALIFGAIYFISQPQIISPI